jgi:hypothetical protein
MADIRTLKLALLADTKNFIDGLDKADKETRTFTNKLDDALKVGAAAFLAVGAAAGAMAVKIGVDAVKAAIEDEKAQVSLATTLRNTTKATDQQVKAVEDYIDKTARATGVTDDQLRPSLDRLVRSTGDVTKAQKLQQLALDISAGTGKDLATITEGLGKAYDGNLGALKRLGVPLDASIIKAKDFDAAVKALSTTFAGQADAAADTFAGRMARITISIDEAKETLGFALLPVLERFATFATETLVPALDDFVAGLTGGSPNSVKNAAKDAKGRILEFNDGLEITSNTGAYGLGVALTELGKTFKGFSDALFGASGQESGLKQFLDLLTSITNGINNVINAYNRLPDMGKFLINPLPDLASLVGTGGKALGSAQQSVNNVIVNISGAIDPQGVARTVTKVLGTASKTSGLKIPQSALSVGLR